MRSIGAAIAAIALAIAGGHARASTVLPLGEAQLTADAERIAVAQVTDVQTRWSSDRTRLETVVTLASDDGAVLTVVQPGGSLGNVRQVVVGMPSYRVGERARFYLRRNLDGETWRVYGWSQGKWSEHVVDGVARYVPGPRVDEVAFTTNGMVWPPSRMPVPYKIHDAGSDDLTPVEVRAAIDAAFATWQDVPCASLTFTYAGGTELGVAIDGENVILFVESGWIYGPESAGATALTIIDGAQTADVAMNGEHFRWAIGPSGALVANRTFDLQGVLTHELGHFSGLSHTMSAHDTMYYSWTPWRNQRTLSLDDKRGLCSIYRVAGDECTAAGGCPAGDACVATPDGRLCEHPADPIGASCNYDHVECADFCLFTAVDLSTGYCSKFCDTNADCPLTHHCDAASAGSMPVKVCFAGAQPPPPVDASTQECVLDEACPAGQYCTSMGDCTLDCRVASDCGPTALCDPRGRCQAADGDDAGGCCDAGGTGPTAALVPIAMVAMWVRRRVRRRPSRRL